jgi:hypothetical protein
MVWALTLTMGFAIAVFLELVARACVARQRLATGFGATLNFAHAGAWLILGAILALPLTTAGVALVSALCR